MIKRSSILILFLSFNQLLLAQSRVTIFPDSMEQNLHNTYEYGAFYVPKTAEAQADFLNNGDHLNTIRLQIVESALNNATDLNGTLAFLDNVSTILQEISGKTEKVIFILEKMPPWLSSSNDGSPALTPGWFVLNTKPPASYTAWNNVIRQVTDRIVNTYGITNAYFEIWNEPDLGSWTGTRTEYFKLFKESYDAIKSVDSSIPVGGPATNHWANNITHIAPFGFISASEGEQSLIANLIDSADVWNKPLDFISWHNFNVTVETHQNAIDFFTEKCSTRGIQLPELFISEWNAPSAVRDTDLHYAFAVKNTIAIKNSAVSSDVIAAWQDFSYSADEFHSDFGLLTYGSIRKPFFNAVSLASELKGAGVKSESNVLISHEASLINDTLVVLISNYAPPPIVEALNHTLFEGQLNIVDLDTEGYVDIGTNDITVLESIYTGSSTVPNTSPLNQAINNSITVYSYFDSIQDIINNVEINLEGFGGDYQGLMYIIDDSTNNGQFTYDSLIARGFTQSNTISQIQGNQKIVGNAIEFIGGSYKLALKPNSVVLLKIQIPRVTSIDPIEPAKSMLRAYPNPSKDLVLLQTENQNIGKIYIFNNTGKLMNTYQFESREAEINMASFPTGIYLIQSDKNKTIKIVKE